MTLHLEIEKVSLRDLSRGRDRLSALRTIIKETHWTFNYTPPSRDYYSLRLSREVLPADVRKHMDMMPGFRVRWRYSGMEVEPEAVYYNYPSTGAFVRNYSNNIHFQFQ